MGWRDKDKPVARVEKPPLVLTNEAVMSSVEQLKKLPGQEAGKVLEKLKEEAGAIAFWNSVRENSQVFIGSVIFNYYKDSGDTRAALAGLEWCGYEQKEMAPYIAEAMGWHAEAVELLSVRLAAEQPSAKDLDAYLQISEREGIQLDNALITEARIKLLLSDYIRR